MQNNQGRGWTPTKLIIVGLIGVFAWGWYSDNLKKKRQERIDRQNAEAIGEFFGGVVRGFLGE